MKPRIVEVEWLDSQSWSGWHPHAQVVHEHSDESDKMCRSVGYLIVDDEHGVTLAQSQTGPRADDGKHPRSWGDTIFVPRSQVKRMTTRCR